MIKKYTNIVGRIETRFIFFAKFVFKFRWRYTSRQPEFDLQILQTKAAA